MRNSAGDWLRRILLPSHWKQWDLIRLLAAASEFKKAVAVSERELGCGQATYTGSVPTEALLLRRNHSLEGLPNWMASLLLQLRSDNQCRVCLIGRGGWSHAGVSGCRVPCFWRVMLVRAVRSHRLRGTSSVIEKAAWTTKASFLWDSPS